MPERRVSVLERLIERLTGRHQLQALARSLQHLSAEQQQQGAATQARLKALSDLVSQRSTAKDANEILHAVRALVRAIEAGGQVPAAGDAEAPSNTRLYRALDDVARGDGPIVVGPWTGEVGFELLYWIPFVEWFRQRWRVRTERLVVVSRGGVEPWYGFPAAKYVDIFTLVSPDVYRDRAARDKQRRVTSFETDVLEAARQHCGLGSSTHLHPQLMYRALDPFWKDESGFGLIARFTNHRRLEPIDDAIVRRLPDEFVAVRFYFSNCFPDKPKNRAAAEAVVGALSAKTPVVVLSPGHRVDDHVDYVPQDGRRVITVPTGPADRNLALQSAVISRARAVVSTYGGYSYIAPFYGVPSVGFYSQQSFKLHHLYAAQRVFEQLGAATVTAVNVADADLVHAATAWSPGATSNQPIAGTASLDRVQGSASA